MGGRTLAYRPAPLGPAYAWGCNDYENEIQHDNPQKPWSQSRGLSEDTLMTVGVTTSTLTPANGQLLDVALDALRLATAAAAGHGPSPA